MNRGALHQVWTTVGIPVETSSVQTFQGDPEYVPITSSVAEEADSMGSKFDDYLDVVSWAIRLMVALT